MAQERIEKIADATGTQTQRAVLAVQDAAERASDYIDKQMTHLSYRAFDLIREANDRIKESTGRPAEAWLADAREFVRTHPMQALAVTIGVGYILGKIVKR
jgi:ElaB/YqjD/DUF883 family membrane-anchored ribosome-binding protein